MIGYCFDHQREIITNIYNYHSPHWHDNAVHKVSLKGKVMFFNVWVLSFTNEIMPCTNCKSSTDLLIILYNLLSVMDIKGCTIWSLKLVETLSAHITIVYISILLWELLSLY